MSPPGPLSPLNSTLSTPRSPHLLHFHRFLFNNVTQSIFLFLSSLTIAIHFSISSAVPPLYDPLSSLFSLSSLRNTLQYSPVFSSALTLHHPFPFLFHCLLPFLSATQLTPQLPTPHFTFFFPFRAPLRHPSFPSPFGHATRALQLEWYIFSPLPELDCQRGN